MLMGKAAWYILGQWPLREGGSNVVGMEVRDLLEVPSGQRNHSPRFLLSWWWFAVSVDDSDIDQEPRGTPTKALLSSQRDGGMSFWVFACPFT